MILPAGCTIGKAKPAPCPACEYIHGDLPTCKTCGATWTPSLQDQFDRAACPECRLRAGVKSVAAVTESEAA